VPGGGGGISHHGGPALKSGQWNGGLNGKALDAVAKEEEGPAMATLAVPGPRKIGPLATLKIPLEGILIKKVSY
jgi:hypothetical protein